MSTPPELRLETYGYTEADLERTFDFDPDAVGPARPGAV